MKPIPYGRQEITSDDIQAVVSALQADFLTQGPQIETFEQDFANYIGAEFAVAVANGTAALHLAVLALGLQPGEYVICTPITFVASINCVRYCGGNILFADIDPTTHLIDINSVRQLLLTHADKPIKGIIPVDFEGHVVQLDELRELAEEHQLWILEDACHAPGGRFTDSKGEVQLAGNGRYADAAIFSFHPVKHIATGEGGMITTNNPTLAAKLRELRTHGISRDIISFENSLEFANGNATDTPSNFPGWYMEMHALGYNYRLTDFQAALGISQLKRAAVNLEKRRVLAAFYAAELANCTGIIRCKPFNEQHAYHLFVLEVENRRGLYDYLKHAGIFCQIHYIPAHLMPYYRQQGWSEGSLPNAEKYYSQCISIPMFASLTQPESAYVVEKIRAFYDK
ncbi:MAG: UDP-4-amino-4,6-dideoxy-N-acetyl-beta-L-altrosamine transaminase [Flavobacteriales bacterium]